MPGIAGEVRRLRKAIERNEFRLVYQPKADMRTGGIVGVEALARWDHPRRGLVSPTEFVPQAERSGSTIQALTEWTLSAAFQQARQWQRDGHELTVAVNLSPRSILDESLTGVVRDLLDQWDVSPKLIQLELTETAVFGMTDP